MNKILERLFLYMVKYGFALKKSALYCTNACCIGKKYILLYRK